MRRGSGGGGSRGYRGGHKGQKRHFTSPEDLAALKEKEEREKQWRQRQGEMPSDSDEEDGSKSDKSKESGSSESSSSSESEEEVQARPKGTEGMIDIENPNRVVNKLKKVSQLDTVDVTTAGKPELSRKEREEIEKSRARASYLRMHAAGKTDEARADLARLALIKKQREDAAKKKDAEIRAREAAKAAKTENVQKALGKKKP